MNNPPYIIVDVFDDIVKSTQSALGIDVLNYQYGYVTELNTTLGSWSKSQTLDAQRFPLVYLAQPFTIKRGTVGSQYGIIPNMNIFILNITDRNWKAADRMANNFKPIINPIYRELLNQISLSGVFDQPGVESLVHEEIDFYYFTDQTGRNVLFNDFVDCKKLQNMQLLVNSNSNCITFKNF